MFNLPANDSELVTQVFNHIAEDHEFDASETLLTMARKYRFAGYIGSIEFLFAEVKRLSEEVISLNEKLRKKRSWW